MASSARPPDFDAAVALARARLVALEHAYHDLTESADGERRIRLLGDLAVRFGRR